MQDVTLRTLRARWLSFASEEGRNKTHREHSHILDLIAAGDGEGAAKAVLAHSAAVREEVCAAINPRGSLSGDAESSIVNFYQGRKTMIWKMTGLKAAGLASALLFAVPAMATECIAPADPGGGWDFTCREVGRLLTQLELVDGNVQVTNMPGGVGAVAFANVAGKRADDADLLVATSTVGITQIAQGNIPPVSTRCAGWACWVPMSA